MSKEKGGLKEWVISSEVQAQVPNITENKRQTNKRPSIFKFAVITNTHSVELLQGQLGTAYDPTF